MSEILKKLCQMCCSVPFWRAGLLQRYLRDQQAATAVEYGLIIGGLSVAIIAVVFNLGEDLEHMFQDFLTAFKAAIIRYS